MVLEELSALIQVILVDLLFAGDNAIAVGLIAAGLPHEQRKRVIAWGVGLAVVARIVFAVLTVQLLKLPGVLLIGGLLLLWVCWRLWIDLRRPSVPTHEQTTTTSGAKQSLTFKQALLQVVAADISMSLDNVLAVAGIAREHLAILVFGLTLSVALMLIAATMIANILTKHKWIAYLGLFIILFVAIKMMWDGGTDIVQIIF